MLRLAAAPLFFPFLMMARGLSWHTTEHACSEQKSVDLTLLDREIGSISWQRRKLSLAECEERTARTQVRLNQQGMFGAAGAIAGRHRPTGQGCCEC